METEVRELMKLQSEVCDLRIVFLGKNVSENSRVRNSILGKDVCESDEPPSSQQHCLRISGTVKDRHVTVINTLHLLNPKISNDQITQTVGECVNLSDPGPHVFILVLQYNDFTKEDMTRVKDVLNTFSEEAIKRTIVITTDEETHDSHTSPVENNTATHQLIKECGGGHLQLEERKTEWQSEILRNVDEIIKENLEEYLTCEMYEDVAGPSKNEERSRSSDSFRSEEENKQSFNHKDDEKLKQNKRSAERRIDIRKWSRSKLSANSSKKQKLNLVLCGSDGSLTVSVSKLLRGKQIKTSHERVSSKECVKREEKIHGRQISLVEFPALSRLSEEEVTRQTLRCVSLCDPGVHAFLLIIPEAPLNNEDKAEIEKIQKNFYSRKHLIVIFINDDAVNRPVTDFINQSPEFQKLISRCGVQYCVMSLKEPENSRQIPEVLHYIENMKTEPYSLQVYVKAQENRVRRETEEKYKEELKRMEKEIKELREKIQSEEAESSDDQRSLRIVLIGKTGSGKSATGNTILGRNEFHSQSSTDSVTTVCEKRLGEVDGRSVAVVDTPGLFDTTLSNEQAVEEIMKCVSLSSPGPHVFVIVLSVGRFTKEETDTLDLIKKIFGHKSAQFSIVLFTRGDDLENVSIEDYVKRSNNADLKKLIRDCGNRFLSFNNKEKQDKTQVIQLLNMIEELKNDNQGRYFTNSMFEEAEMSIKKRMEEILKEREREIQAQKEELLAKYEREMKDMMKRLEEEKQRADEERDKMDNQLREKEEKLRKEFEKREKREQKKREIENQKRSEEEKQKRAEYHQKIEELKRETENQRLQYEKQQKEREEEDRKREEKYRQDQEKMKNEQERIIAELQMKQEEETKKRESEEKRRIKEDEKERKEWERKIKEAENDKKETQEDIKRQQREWEDEKIRKMKEREEEERKRKEKHEEQLREKQEELEKMRKRFEREREEERQKIEEEREKQRREREEKEREYETERKRHEQLERERKEEWERRKQEDEERRENDRKTWERKIENLKQEQEEEKKRRETEEKERKEREEKARNERKQKHEEEIKDVKKKHEEEARKQAEETNELKGVKEALQQKLEEHQKQHETLEKLFKLQNLNKGLITKLFEFLRGDQIENFHERLQEAKGEELQKLQEEVDKLLKQKMDELNKSKCVIQ